MHTHEEFEKILQEYFPIVWKYPLEIYCDKGWFDILLDLCFKLEVESHKLTEEEQKDFKILQIKEKFGGLRFYTEKITQNTGHLINEAENKSEVTCEVCGNPGVSRSEGWIKTLCEEHASAKGRI